MRSGRTSKEEMEAWYQELAMRYRKAFAKCKINWLKVDFDPIKIEENIYHLIDDLNKAKPSSAKGKYMKNITISSTMGPGIRVDLSSVENRG